MLWAYIGWCIFDLEWFNVKEVLKWRVEVRAVFRARYKEWGFSEGVNVIWGQCDRGDVTCCFRICLNLKAASEP